MMNEQQFHVEVMAELEQSCYTAEQLFELEVLQHNADLENENECV